MQGFLIEQPALRAAGLRHTGPYFLIGQAFGRLGPLVATSGLEGAGRRLIAVYYDNPEQAAAESLRSDAAILLKPEDRVPAGLTEVTLVKGLYLTGKHLGSYEGLPPAWDALRREMGRLGVRRREGPSYEIYLNTPIDTAPKDLVTEIYIPVEK